jgi:hypothetical protein
MGPADCGDRLAIAGRSQRFRCSAEGERDHPKTGNGDREKEPVSKQPLEHQHDRTPLFDQTIEFHALPTSAVDNPDSVGRL